MKRKTIIISDLHLGTPDAQPQKLLHFLEKNTCEKLILNGDIIDTRYLKFLGTREPKHEKILTQIKEICKKNQTQMFYLRGNHERSASKIPHTFHELQQEITITSNKKKYIVCHGDSFESEISKLDILTIILFFTDSFFGRLDRTLSTEYKISHFLKKIYACITRQKSRFENKLIAYAQEKKADGIICGHIHHPENKTINNIHYLNSGDWTETCSALAEDDTGNRKILYAK